MRWGGSTSRSGTRRENGRRRAARGRLEVAGGDVGGHDQVFDAAAPELDAVDRQAFLDGEVDVDGDVVELAGALEAGDFADDVALVVEHDEAVAFGVGLGDEVFDEESRGFPLWVGPDGGDGVGAVAGGGRGEGDPLGTRIEEG